ncbi:uncharacterized protein LOC131250982 [Magnolia sinica]|uniref:uncharacterized protein LOC131250982 n=1 Tax=Magnolia sinica TaxID=86752 RepID=UPI002658D2F5|nr:uncharacterized protein LOC131250982 [Magnolia sinica]
MFPKRRFFPLLLLFLTVLSFYSYSQSSLHLFPLHQSHISNFSPPNHHISNSTPRNSQIPTLIIKLLAFDRLASLSRCLRSVAAADYASDRVHLHIFVDHFKPLDPSAGPDEVGRKIAESRAILAFVDAFVWKFGEKVVHYRTGNVGLQAQWLEAWWPASDEEFAFVVEDDLEVSPLYYRFLKGLILNYYYNKENFSPMVYGASLQRPRFVAGKHGNKLQLDGDTRLFLYHMVGTWGQLLFPKPWKEFRLWYDEHKAKDIKPILQGMVTTGWYKKMGERIWTPWFIKFIHSRGYYNIYTNFLHERALSVSHRDAGVNYGKTAGPDSELIDASSLDFNLWEMQPLRNLKWYDFCFREVLPNRVVTRFDELGSVLNSVQKQKTIMLVSLYRTPPMITRNLLCHFERLNIQNCVFIGVDSEFLSELASRGHPVIDAAQLINDVRSKLMGIQGSNTELIKEILVKAFVIKQCLESGYDSWVIGGNILPISEAFPETIDNSYDFSATKDVELLFIRSSRAAVKIWVDSFIHKLVSTAKSFMVGDSLARDHMHFGYFTARALEEKGARIKRIDEVQHGLKVGGAHVNQTSLESGKKMAFWSSEMGLDLIQRRLKDIGVWVIDGDEACTAVVCHQS